MTILVTARQGRLRIIREYMHKSAIDNPNIDDARKLIDMEMEHMESVHSKYRQHPRIARLRMAHESLGQYDWGAGEADSPLVVAATLLADELKYVHDRREYRKEVLKKRAAGTGA